jgi:hypothetical protein
MMKVGWTKWAVEPFLFQVTRLSLLAINKDAVAETSFDCYEDYANTQETLDCFYLSCSEKRTTNASHQALITSYEIRALVLQKILYNSRKISSDRHYAYSG